MYEITFITKEETDPIVKKTIESQDGKIVNEHFLGRKKFAYTINKQDAGFYTSYTFELDPSKLSELDKTIRLSGQVIRHLTVAKRPAQLKPKVVKEKPLDVARNNEEKTEEPEEIDKKVEKPVEVIEQKEIKKSVKKADKIEKIEKEEAKPIARKEEKLLDETRNKETTKPKSTEKELPVEEERLKALEEKLNELLKD